MIKRPRNPNVAGSAKILLGFMLVSMAARASAQTELITNGGFESGLSSWTTSGSFYANAGFTCYHAGSRYAYFSLADGTASNNLTGTMYQQIALPSSATIITLSFWKSITSPEPGSTAYDFLTATVETTGGSTLATVASYSNLNKTATSGCASYSQKTFDLTPWKGQTVRIKFAASTDPSYPSIFRIDDVSVTATSLPAPSISSVSPTSMPGSTSLQTLTINGSNFVNVPTLTFDPPTGPNINSTAARLTFVSSSRIDYEINNGNDIGAWQVRVNNPDGQQSNWQSFSVTSVPPAPSISSVSPTSMPGSTSLQTLTINGSNFVNVPTLTFDPPTGPNINSTAARLTFVSSSQIDYEINNGNDIGAWQVRVNNPDGQQSNWQSFSVTSVPSSGEVNVMPRALYFGPSTKPPIFIEIDWMDDTDHSHKPSQAVLDEIVHTFAIEGYEINFELSNAIPHQDSLDIVNWHVSGSPEIQAIASANFDHVADSRYFYSIWGHDFGVNGGLPEGRSGVADLPPSYPGRFHLITLGSFPSQTGTFNDQVGTFIHEFGHNLGQSHGGSDSYHFKPNYLSVMNYYYQTSGVPDGIIALEFANSTLGINAFGYSHGWMPSLNESSLSEPLGIGLGRAVDWNCNGLSNETGIAKNINWDTSPIWSGRCATAGTLSTIADFDNWTAISSYILLGLPKVVPPKVPEPCITRKEQEQLEKLAPPRRQANAYLLGNIFYIHNYGPSDLDVTAITPSSSAPWLTWTPLPPFTVDPGEAVEVAVSVNYGLAPAGVSTRTLQVASSDSDESPFGVVISVNNVGQPTPTASPTASPSRTPTASPTKSPTASPTKSPTPSPTLSATPTTIPTASPTRTPTASPTKSPTPSPTASPTPSPTTAASVTPSPTKTPTASPTRTPTANPTGTPTVSPTMSPTAGPSPSPSATSTASPTSSPTAAPCSILIPDSGVISPYPLVQTVAGLPVTITKVIVQITGLTHTYPDDLDIVLAGPEGQSVMLMSDAGEELDVVGADLLFDDAAGSALPDTTQIVSGSWQPTDFQTGETMTAPAPAGPYATALSAFDGTDPNGDWKLWVLDDAQIDQGCFTSWSVVIEAISEDAALQTHNLPGQLAASHLYPARITMRNTGGTAWSAAEGHSLAVTTDTCGMAGSNRISIPDGTVIAPGESHLLETMLVVPATLGLCTLQFQMVLDIDVNANFFGEIVAVSPNVVAAVNNATHQNDTIPATMAPNQSLGVGITMRNTGTTAWFEGSGHSLAVTGSPCMIAPGTRIYPRPGDIVMPNTSYQFATQLAAPGAPGPCAIDFRMVEEFVEFFGETAAIIVNVADPPNSTADWSVYE